MLRWLLPMLMLCSCAGTTVVLARTPGEIDVGGTLPEAVIQGLNGPSKRLSEYRGKPLIINVWASWCGPCVAEMASLERLAWLDSAAHFAVIGVSTDDYADDARALLKKSNATLSQFIDTRLQMEHMLGATRLPLTVFVDAKGRVLGKVYGARQWDDADALRLIGQMFRISMTRPLRQASLWSARLLEPPQGRPSKQDGSYEQNAP